MPRTSATHGRNFREKYFRPARHSTIRRKKTVPNQETHELQIDFEIQGVDFQGGEVQVRPRQPNVVSRRGHRVKIIGSIYDVPDPTAATIVRLSDATVDVFSNAVMGEKGDLARPSQQWGTSEQDREVEIRPGDLDPDNPPTVSIIVEPNDGDDHLGQGPDYQATVDVSSQTITFTTDEETATNDEKGTAATGGDRDTGTQTFNIPFSSK
jgi:hypothetical protein